MTIIDIYGRRYIVEVFKEAIVLLSCSRSDKFEVISGLREDFFFFTPKPVRVRRMAIKNANCPARDEPRGDWPRNIQWKILMKKAAKNWLIIASLIWIDLLTSHEKWAEGTPSPFATTCLTYLPVQDQEKIECLSAPN